MYKVFFNDRIVLINDQPALENVKLSTFHEVQTSNQLRILTENFIENSKVKTLYIWNSDLKKIKDWFFAQFKIIEAAGGVVFNSKQELLCIHRLGKWDLPKGKIEKEESSIEGAIREVEEECGISKPKVVKLLETSYHLYQNKYDNNQWVLKPTYWYLMNYTGDENITPQTEESIDKAEWINAKSIDVVLNETYASLLPVFEKAAFILK